MQYPNPSARSLRDAVLARTARPLFFTFIALLSLLVAPSGIASVAVLNDGGVGTATNTFEFVGSSWTYRASGQPSYLGDDHYAKLAGSYYQVRFSGTYAKIYTAKGAGAGIAAISLDGGAETLVDLYAPSRQNQALVY